MKSKVMAIAAWGLLLTVSGRAETPRCSAQHCTAIGPDLKRICAEKTPSDKPVYVYGPDGKVCTCSCRGDNAASEEGASYSSTESNVDFWNE